ncbi:Adenosylmethionine-8-amino-7-oxononanoate aminotransferase [hydrothermal vent metagenome]|uniref:Adenosylmethionine-8-amino-7-oxononanoate aminotransferase n=1 Tax=hydrothermal vent metagenome TaxID=652676 RepID=A0A3B1BAW2_9ZZZZ
MNSNTIDQDHIWHPYSALQSELPVYQVSSAHGVRITLADGRELIDGMSSWWSTIHGYNNSTLNQAIQTQMHKMSHIMFGGFTHQPAIELTQKLIDITPSNLQTVFYSDSGSIAVEVALKMAIQYCLSKGQTNKRKFIALRSGYHGDTFAAMSVSDPDTGMHQLFEGMLATQVFIEQPQSRFGENCSTSDLESLERTLMKHADTAAAVIMEPIVQAAGSMWFYSADYLLKVRQLCDKYGILLILDEIATGFGRTGKLFACEHADIAPDIMCIGKSLTGGYLTLAATLTSTHVAATIDAGDPGVFMHGPTFMANPLACSVALASIKLLQESNWQLKIKNIEQKLSSGLAVCANFDNVKDVRVLGAIGVIEMQQAVDMKTITLAFVDAGIWLRPFGKLVYVMPAFIISENDLDKLIRLIISVIKALNE